MILFDRKKALNQILGSPPVNPEEMPDPLETMAKEAMSAFESKDAKGFAAATHAMFLHFGNQSAPGVEQE